MKKPLLTLDNYKKELKIDNITEVDFKYLNIHYILSEDFIIKFQYDIDFNKLSWAQSLSMSIIREFADKVNWTHISAEQIMSEEFILEMQDKVDWIYISQFQLLSEEFILKMRDRVNRVRISEFQELSEKFIEDNLDMLNLRKIVESRSLSNEFCIKHNVKSNILKSVFHCGHSHRCIYITKDEPDLINIGCFKGTKDEAITRIIKDYDGQERDNYISKVNECFNV